MLIEFSVSNFLSFNETQTLSMKAGKARKSDSRIYKDNYNKLTKTQAIFGANASGKSNLIRAIQFMQDMVLNGFPRGFSNQYFRQIPENQSQPSSFEIKILLGAKRIVYGFSVHLKSGSIKKEYLYALTKTDIKRKIFERDLDAETFKTGEYFKNNNDINKIKMYGDDSSSDVEMLFLTVMNHGKTKMYVENQNLEVFRQVYLWFRDELTVSDPNSPLTGYPYFSETNLPKLSKLLNALGIGTSEVKMIKVPEEVVKTKVPEEVYERVIANIEINAAKKETEYPAIMLRSYKEFYIFELNEEGTLSIKTIQFSHENEEVFFNLGEESDGTARLLDVIEILFNPYDDRVFVIDEIDRCLHPALTTKIISLFLDMAKKRNAQLVITSHESRLLEEELFRNDEMCFVIKNGQGESMTNPLESFHLRTDKKVYAALFDGSLGNVLPYYDDEHIKMILNDDE